MKFVLLTALIVVALIDVLAAKIEYGDGNYISACWASAMAGVCGTGALYTIVNMIF